MKDSVVYQISSEFDGKHFECAIYGRDLVNDPKWNTTNELPVKINDVIDESEKAFRKTFPDYSKFQLQSVKLIHLKLIDRWLFDIEYNGSDYLTSEPGDYLEKRIDLVVLMNGKLVLPTF